MQSEITGGNNYKTHQEKFEMNIREEFKKKKKRRYEYINILNKKYKIIKSISV